MTIAKGFLIVLPTAAAGGLFGCGIGTALGYFTPAFYYAMFHMPPVREYAVQVGAGLGLTQGLLAGMVVGCVVTLAVAWYESRQRG